MACQLNINCEKKYKCMIFLRERGKEENSLKLEPEVA